MTDPTWPPLPPPPPTSPEPPSYAMAPPYGYPAMQAGAPLIAPKKNRTVLWVGLGVVVALGLGAAIWKGSSSNDKPTTSAVVASSLPLPGQGVEASGPSGWAMTISPEWTDAAQSGDGAEGGWTTGGGGATFSSFVNVYAEAPPSDITLKDYIQISKTNLPSQLPGAVIASSDFLRFGDQEVVRFEYSATVRGVDVRFVAYIAKTDIGFAVATFAAPESLFAEEASLVEPYLSTLRAQ